MGCLMTWDCPICNKGFHSNKEALINVFSKPSKSRRGSMLKNTYHGLCWIQTCKKKDRTPTALEGWDLIGNEEQGKILAGKVWIELINIFFCLYSFIETNNNPLTPYYQRWKRLRMRRRRKARRKQVSRRRRHLLPRKTSANEPMTLSLRREPSKRKINNRKSMCRQNNSWRWWSQNTKWKN